MILEERSDLCCMQSQKQIEDCEAMLELFLQNVRSLCELS